MDPSNHPTLAFRFGQLKATFKSFCEAEGEDDQDRAFLLYLKFKTLAEIIAEDAEEIAGHPTSFDEESQRVMGWMAFAVGLNEATGYCGSQSDAEYILESSLRWD